MSAGRPTDIERLIAWREDGTAAEPRGGADERLAAELAEALSRDGAAPPPEADDIARAAAYLGRTLSPAERDAFVARLADGPEERAELAASAAFIESLDGEGTAPPAHLLARAKADFVAAAADLAPRRPARRGWSAIFVPGPVMGLAAAALAAVVITPWALLQREVPQPVEVASTTSVAPAPAPPAALAPQADSTIVPRSEAFAEAPPAIGSAGVSPLRPALEAPVQARVFEMAPAPPPPPPPLPIPALPAPPTTAAAPAPARAAARATAIAGASDRLEEMVVTGSRVGSALTGPEPLTAKEKCDIEAAAPSSADIRDEALSTRAGAERDACSQLRAKRQASEAARTGSGRGDAPALASPAPLPDAAP